jgi:serine/threonine protein phosphatase PrpC
VISSYGSSNPGCIRPENEDRLLIDPQLELFVVADGMGGHSFGEVAAEMALGAIRQYVDSSRNGAEVTWPFGYNFNLTPDANRLVTAIQLANRRVFKRSEDSPEYAGMGTTVAAVLVTADKATIASVGDSRVYLFREGTLDLLTDDDTWVSAMVREGTLDAREAPHHPMRNVLTQAAGARENVAVQVREHALANGDMLLMSSDGLHGVVDEVEIRSILEEAAWAAADLERPGSMLIQAAIERGGPDNVSCILLRYSLEPVMA